jgi:hypothetical protein
VGLAVVCPTASPWLSPAWAKMLTVVSRAKKETRILFIVFVFFTKVNLLENSFVAESATGA